MSAPAETDSSCTEPPVFDPFDPAVVADPGPAYSRLNATCPFARHEGPDQTFWIVSGHDEIKNKVLQHSPVWTFRFGNAQKDGISDVGFKTDPPFHSEFRAALSKGFAPKALARYSGDVERIVAERIDAMLALPEGQGDFHDLFAFPLPARMMCLMIGAPEESYQDYKRWADRLQYLIFSDPTPGSFNMVLEEIYPHFNGLLDQRVALLQEAGLQEALPEHLGMVLPDDFMSRAMIARVEGRPLTREEQLNVCLAFLTGGQETTIGLLTNLVWRLLEDRARWEALKADPSLIEAAVEESLRYDPPVLAHFRTSLEPTELHGCPLPERAKLMFAIAAANRDAEVFERPDDFRIDRPVLEARKHLSFGSGIHFCIGAPIARLEAQIALKRLLERLPDLRLLGSGERIDGWMHWGRAHLPVAWG
jgi:cytochrome P450